MWDFDCVLHSAAVCFHSNIFTSVPRSIFYLVLKQSSKVFQERAAEIVLFVFNFKRQEWKASVVRTFFHVV